MSKQCHYSNSRNILCKSYKGLLSWNGVNESQKREHANNNEEILTKAQEHGLQEKEMQWCHHHPILCFGLTLAVDIRSLLDDDQVDNDRMRKINLRRGCQGCWQREREMLASPGAIVSEYTEEETNFSILMKVPWLLSFKKHSMTEMLGFCCQFPFFVCFRCLKTPITSRSLLIVTGFLWCWFIVWSVVWMTSPIIIPLNWKY